MNYGERRRAAAAVAFLIAMFAAPLGLWGQLAIRQANMQRRYELINVFLYAEREHRRTLSRAEELIAEERYTDAVSLLGLLLTDPEIEDQFLGADDDASPSLAGEGTQKSLKHEARRMIGDLPPAGREEYERQFGAEARDLLQQAVAEGDVNRLTDATRMYFHTEAGYQATMLLARHHLDHGRPLAAALCFKRLADTPEGSALFEPQLSILLATSWLLAESPQPAQEVLAALKRTTGRTSIRLGGRDVPLFVHESEAIEWLAGLVGSAGIADGAISRWLVVRGNAARNGKSAGGLPQSDLAWRTPVVVDPHDEETVHAQAEQYAALPAIPAGQPLAVGDTVVFRSPEKLMGVNFVTGKRVWEFPWTDGNKEGHSELAQSNVGVHTQRGIALAQRVWDDYLYGQLASDGERIFLLDEVGYATNQLNGQQQLRVVPGGGTAPLRYGAKSTNNLVALSVDREGAMMWMVGGADGDDEPRLAGAFFLGPPLPLNGRLYVLAEMNSEIRLVVLDAKNGHLDWSQQLAHLENQPITSDGLRRLAGATPSFADGVLVCPTSAGAVVAVDLSTRSLLWGFQYKQLVVGYPHRGIMQGRAQQPPGSRWEDAAAVIADGTVIVTPVESDRIFCLDLLTGKSLWPGGVERGENIYVACLHDDKVVLVGKTKVTALRLADGKPAWSTPLKLNAFPSGRGFYSGEEYYLPTADEHLVVVNLKDGSEARKVETKGSLGNLLIHQGHLVSQSHEWLLAQPLNDAE